MIDFRSDTVTRPTPQMLEAMARAPLGDDGYQDDPTTLKLEAFFSKWVEMADSVLVPSGTMGNLASLLAHHPQGGTLIAAQDAHIVTHELEGTTQVGRFSPVLIGKNGRFSTNQLSEAIQRLTPSQLRQAVISVENTVTADAGSIVSIEEIEKITSLAQRTPLPIHLDGARLPNAIITTGIPAPRWALGFDTVTVCLSKGLGAPVGALAAGRTLPLAQKIRAMRHRLGGRMRQSGILAAAGLYGFENHFERLQSDHEKAKFLADNLKQLGFNIEPPETNILFVRFQGPIANQIAKHLSDKGILLNAIDPHTLRVVTHLDIQQEDIEILIKHFESNPWASL